MKNQLTKLAVAVISMTLLVPAFSIRSQDSTQTVVQHVGQSPKPAQLREHQAYELLFKRIASLETQAEDRERDGIDGTALRQLIPNRLCLSSSQTVILRTISHDCLANASALDRKAFEIIRAFRSKYPNGHFDSRKGFPRAPVELDLMQAERDRIFLQGKKILQSSFDPAEFASFEQRLQKFIMTRPRDMR